MNLAETLDLFSESSPYRICEHCGKRGTIGDVVPYGIGPYVWLHHKCWEEKNNV